MGVFDTALLVSAVLLTTPILLAATGELVSERAGVLNIGLEGMMLAGAFFAFWGYDTTGSLLVGVLCGIAAGTLLAAVMAAVSIDAGADQVIVGIGIVVLGAGITSYASGELFGNTEGRELLAVAGPLDIPILRKVPVLGQVLFEQKPFVYGAAAMLGLTAWVLFRTRTGLAIRAAGDMPDAVLANGLSVRAVRWGATLFAGAMAGLAGAFLVVGEVGTFLDEMTAGRGYLALAAVIFGGWRVGGVLAACFAFGFTDALQLRLQATSSIPAEVWILLAVLLAAYAVWQLRRPAPGRGTRAAGGIASLAAAAAVVLAIVHPAVGLPSQFWLALPYLVTLVALASFRSRSSMPRYLGLNYSPTRASI
ncbi:MAG: ABC transporter permease [Solirubrobacterales bacterium]